MSLSLSLLGSFVANLDNRPLKLTARKAQALLAYLAVESTRPHYREALCGLFWPDYPETSARASLRQTLQLLRQALGDRELLTAPGHGPATGRAPIILVLHETIQINREAGYQLDVDVLDAAVTSLRTGESSPAEVEALRAAVALYRGPFLEGFSLGRFDQDHQGDSLAFEEWLLLKREQCNRQVLLALSTLAAHDEGRGAWEQALAHAQRVVALEPWQEEAHQQIMRLLLPLGRRSEALAQYRRYREIIARELGSEPGPEITALYNSLRSATGPAPVLSAPEPGATRGIALADERIPTPNLVAREEELARLYAFLRQVLAGTGRVALVTGEAGSGKTALLEEFARQAMVAHAEVLAIAGRCSAQGGADAYEAVREALRMLAGEPEGLLGPRHERRLQGALPQALEALAVHGPDLVRWLARDTALASRARACAPRGAAWLARLQSLAEQSNSAAAPGLPQAALCEQGAQVLHAIAQQRPILLLLDDMQWADPPTLGMLSYLGRHLEHSRILVLCAYRSHDLAAPAGPQTIAAHPLAALADEFQRRWGDIRIDLAQAEPRRFVDAYLDSWPNHLTMPFRRTLARHTGGNTLFTVELVRAMQERGDLVRDGQGRWIEGADLAWNKLPPRVEGAISYRVGQLTPAQQELLEVASVEGEQFHAEILARVLGTPVQAVTATLSGPLGRQAHLVTPSGWMQVGGRELARYRFRHGLFQAYLYGRLDQAIRAHWHGAVAAAIEELYAEQASQLARQLAWHQQEAGQELKAAQSLLEAGRQAAWVGAHGQAMVQYQKALGLIADKARNPERVELETSLLLALGESLRVAQGLGTPERSEPTSRAYALGQQLGAGSPLQLRALCTLAELYMLRGELPRATELALELLALAVHTEDSFYASAGHVTLATCSLLQGQLDSAEEHLRQVQDLTPSPTRRCTDQDVWPQRNIAGLAASYLLWARGYADQARRRMERLAAGQEGGAQYVTAYIQCMVALFYAVSHDDHSAVRWAEEALRTMDGRDMPEALAWCRQIQGWAEARSGEPMRGIARIRAAMDTQPREGTLLYHFGLVSLLAEASLAGGQVAAAAQVLDEALALMENRGTRFYEAELWRLRGETSLREREGSAQAGPPDAKGFEVSEMWLGRAIEMAQKQGARMWELRATVSLAGLWKRQGKVQEARDALAAVYARFSEGFDTPDLVEARALLHELGIPLPTA